MPKPRKYTPEEVIERAKESSKQSYLNNKDKKKEYVKQWKRKNRKQREQNNPLYKLSSNIRSLIFSSFRQNKHRKKSNTIDILGCSFEQFKQHIESQFEPWMNWGNRGGKVVVGPDMTWDLDHIIPISSAVTEDDVKRLNHYTNFQPLCSYQNRFVKRNKT